MSKPRTEWKVGLFVLISLVLLGALVMRFSKGTALFASTYEVKLIAKNVGGIIPGAQVLMAGVPVGLVEEIELRDGGKQVAIHLSIYERFRVHRDAIFSIKQMGFLGDRYISIEPTENEGPVLEDGGEVAIEDPFDLQEVARTATGLLGRVDEATKRLNLAVERVDRNLLSEQALGNLTSSFTNFRLITERALKTLDNVDDFVRTNAHPLSASVSNLVFFSEQMAQISGEFREIVQTNRGEVRSAVKNVELAAEQMNQLMTDLQDGKGLVGSLLQNEELQAEFSATMRNFNLLSSNLNRHGILWKPRNTTASEGAPPYTGRSPFR